MINNRKDQGTWPGHAVRCRACEGNARRHDDACTTTAAAWQRLDDALREAGHQLRLALVDHWPTLLALYALVVVAAVVVELRPW